MQRVTLVRYATKPAHTAENARLSRAVFEDVRRMAPAGVAYALFQTGDDFVHLFVNAQDDSADALVELPSFKAYQAGVMDRCVAPPEVTRIAMEMIEAYGLPRAMAKA